MTMSSALTELEHDLIKLPRRLRARLAKRLIQSLDDQSDSTFEEVGIEEILLRAEELRSGKIKGIPAAKALEKARALLK
jgi:hypothetical protein